MQQTVEYVDIGSLASAIGDPLLGSAHGSLSFAQAYANLVERLRIRGFQTSYVGSDNDEIDYFVAGEHGTVRLKWQSIVQAGPHQVEQMFPEPTYSELVREAFGVMDDYLEKKDMTLLIPDRERENQEDFIWCVPIERVKWNKWFELSQKFKCITPREHGGVRYMNRMEGKEVRTILMMPTEDQSDDDAMHACAFLRLVKGLTCRIYVVRCSDEQLSSAQMIARYAGADVKLVEDLDDSELPGANENNTKP
jgi:hypothetical protein